MTKVLLIVSGEDDRMPEEVIDEWKVVLEHPAAKTAIVLVDYDEKTDTWMSEIAVLYEGDKDGLLKAVEAEYDEMPADGVLKIKEEEDASQQSDLPSG